MGFIIDHQNRSLVAGAEAADRQQREAAISCGLAETDAELFAYLVTDLLITSQKARHAVADLDDISTDRAAEDQVVESGHALDVGCGDSEEMPDHGYGIVRYPAVAFLHDLERPNARGARIIVVPHFFLDRHAIIDVQQVGLCLCADGAHGVSGPHPP